MGVGNPHVGPLCGITGCVLVLVQGLYLYMYIHYYTYVVLGTTISRCVGVYVRMLVSMTYMTTPCIPLRRGVDGLSGHGYPPVGMVIHPCVEY